MRKGEGEKSIDQLPPIRALTSGWACSLGQGHSDDTPNRVHEAEKSPLNFNAQESKNPASASTAKETVYSEIKNN